MILYDFHIPSLEPTVFNNGFPTKGYHGAARVFKSKCIGSAPQIGGINIDFHSTF